MSIIGSHLIQTTKPKISKRNAMVPYTSNASSRNEERENNKWTKQIVGNVNYYPRREHPLFVITRCCGDAHPLFSFVASDFLILIRVFGLVV